jgi:hypothetical protein
MKKTVAACLVMLIGLEAFPLYAQNGNQQMKRFRLLFEDGGCIEGKNGYLDGSRFVGTSNTGDPVAVPLGDIRALYRRGNHARNGAAYGAGIGFISSLAGLASASSQNLDGSIETDWLIGFFAAMTASGAILGFLAGSAMARWERVPFAVVPESASYRGTVRLGARFSF